MNINLLSPQYVSTRKVIFTWINTSLHCQCFLSTSLSCPANCLNHPRANQVYWKVGVGQFSVSAWMMWVITVIRVFLLFCVDVVFLKETPVARQCQDGALRHALGTYEVLRFYQFCSQWCCKSSDCSHTQWNLAVRTSVITTKIPGIFTGKLLYKTRSIEELPPKHLQCVFVSAVAAGATLAFLADFWRQGPPDPGSSNWQRYI